MKYRKILLAYNGSQEGKRALFEAADLAAFLQAETHLLAVASMPPSLFLTGITSLAPEEMQKELTRDNAFPRRMGKPEEYAQLALAIVRNPMLNGSCIRLDAGVRFAPK